MAEYRPGHIDAKDAIGLAMMTIKQHYNTKQKPIFMEEGDWAHIRLHKGYNLPNAAKSTHSIQAQCAGPFKVLRRVGTLAYEMKIPKTWGIHPIISTAHLEPSPDPSKDPYKRTRPPAPPLLRQGVEEWEI